MVSNKNTFVISNLYTVILAIASGTVIATTIYVVIKCLADYGTIFKVIEASH